jgi:ketosteroid isomerase-like protein
MTRFSACIAAAAAAAGLAASGALASNREMIADPEFRAFLESFEKGTQNFLNGDTRLWKENASIGEDVVIMGAWGAYEKGWAEASKRYDWAGSRFQPGGAELDVEYLASKVSGDLAFTVAIERSKVMLASEDALKPMQLRVTHVFRREGGRWKLMLRHADPMMKKTPPAATLQN